MNSRGSLQSTVRGLYRFQLHLNCVFPCTICASLLPQIDDMARHPTLHLIIQRCRLIWCVLVVSKVQSLDRWHGFMIATQLFSALLSSNTKWIGSLHWPSIWYTNSIIKIMQEGINSCQQLPQRNRGTHIIFSKPPIQLLNPILSLGCEWRVMHHFQN
jgi:hypothetical protein